MIVHLKTLSLTLLDEAAFRFTIISRRVTDSAHLWGKAEELRFNQSPFICNAITNPYKRVPAGRT